MQVIDKFGEVVDIFAVYWNIKTQETCFFGLASEHTGRFKYNLDDIDIIDSKINFKTVYVKGDDDFEGFYHWALIQAKLWDDLVSGNMFVREKFLKIARSEKIIDW